MIARAPLQLFQAVSTSILPHLTSLHTSEEPGSEDEFHRSVRMVLLGLVAFTALALLFMAAVGPKARLREQTRAAALLRDSRSASLRAPC